MKRVRRSPGSPGRQRANSCEPSHKAPENKQRAEPEPARLRLAMVLSSIAGFVDAVGYIALYQVFVANMSGNTIALGVQSVQQHWDLFFRRGAAIPVFVLGMLLSKWGIYWAERRRVSFLPALVYGLEALLLGLFVLIGMGTIVDGKVQTPSVLKYYFLVALPSLAMGLQNATHTHYGPFNLHTTHVTGTLAKFTDELAQFLVWFGERAQRPTPTRVRRALAAAQRQTSLRNAVFLAGVWTCYAVGAFAGALSKQKWELLCLLFPIALLLVIAGADLGRPRALQARGESS